MGSLMARRHTWIYAQGYTYTQTHASGGAIRVRITPTASRPVRVLGCYARNSGTNSLYITLLRVSSSCEIVQYLNIGPAAQTTGSMPRTQTNMTSSAVSSSEHVYIPPGWSLYIRQTETGAQNDTLTIHVVLEFEHDDYPSVSWDKSASTNAASVTQSDPLVDREVMPGRVME